MHLEEWSRPFQRSRGLWEKHVEGDEGMWLGRDRVAEPTGQPSGRPVSSASLEARSLPRAATQQTFAASPPVTFRLVSESVRTSPRESAGHTVAQWMLLSFSKVFKV